MEGWTDHRGEAVVLDMENVDTDQLIPARFMSVPRSEGYGPYLLHDQRRDRNGALDKDFVLNRHPDVSILIAGRNFGSGSSREAAVYALVDAGIRVVIAPGFGDIFAANAVNNGLLPATVADRDAEALREMVKGGTASMEVSLASGQIRCDGLAVPFELDETRRMKLRHGWDDIDLTLQSADLIAEFRERREAMASWAWPRGGS